VNVDVAVVGLGLIGSAALRYLTDTDLHVVGIGPEEPADLATHQGPFASYYDSGRVTRRIDTRREWAVLASRSIAEYGILEQRSSMRFHSPSGFIFVRNDAQGIAHQKAVAAELGIPITLGTAADRQPAGLIFPDGFTTLSEPSPAGHIDPRGLVAAQLRIAEAQGANVLRSTVSSVQKIKGGFEVRCGPTTLRAEQLLVATGSYGNDLLPEPLAMSVRPEAVILAEVAQSIEDMPAVICLLESSHYNDVYLVPPVRYPDGHTYLKMGGSSRTVRPFSTSEERHAWMSGGQADAQLGNMRAIMESFLPNQEFLSWGMKPCLIADTVSGMPYIDQIDKGWFVAVGGNGHAAKSSDAIGALASSFISEESWIDSELEQSEFAAIFGKFSPGEESRHGN